MPHGGGDRIRTDDRLVANQVLYQLSYAPDSNSNRRSEPELVGLRGFEPLTSRLSGGRSNQLSYRPTRHSLSGVKGLDDLVKAPQAQAHDVCFGPANHRSGLGYVLLQRRRSSDYPLRKEVIQPQVPLRLPCYDLVPITSLTLGCCLLAVSSHTSGKTGFHDLTGGVYKPRERIHGVVADTPLLAIPTSWSRVADSNPNWERV